MRTVAAYTTVDGPKLYNTTCDDALNRSLCEVITHYASIEGLDHPLAPAMITLTGLTLALGSATMMEKFGVKFESSRPSRLEIKAPSSEQVSQ